MSDPYISEIQIFAFEFAPRGWAQCNGQILPINQNQALFSLLGTTYGGNGQTTFALPDLRGRAPMHIGNNFSEGQVGGQEFHTLTTQEIPLHTHLVTASSATADQTSPVGNLWAKGDSPPPYKSTANSSMSGSAIGNAGSSQGHENRMPWLAINYCIAIQGIFPSRN